jgi:hypothetical protein
MPSLARVMILFCGQGMTTLLEIYKGGVVKDYADYLALIDCGGSGEGGELAVKYVGDKIISSGNYLNALIISHQDGDHVALLKKLTERLEGEKCSVGKVFAGGSNWSRTNKKTVTDFLTEMDFDEEEVEFDAPYLSHYAKAPSKAKLKALDKYDDVSLRVLVSGLQLTGTGRTADIVRNASSAVVVVDKGSSCVVLPGDATHQTMEAVNGILTVKKFLPTVTGFEIPHHGALRTAVENYYARGEVDDFDWSVITAFANHIKAQQVVASAGPKNHHRHPVEEVLNVFEGNLVAAGSHGYNSYVFKRGGDGVSSEGWTNFINIKKAEHCTVHKYALDTGNYTYGNLSVDLTTPGLLAPEEIVTFHPLGTFGPGGMDDDPVVFAPAPAS